MRLHKIRLAGFKSFVDPTTILFPSDLIAVVGPNGCGKSNVIDAVRWVMGESSAKHLRGDSMADVVFNGSTSRKAASQASVELVFDNTAGRIGGRYASYAEIAVRRQVGRDGQSSYYMNGTRCRRRDITDIFLGTGLGPRSYAIIEQGMISRLIEARPEELRQFLEEAAGISKYKERRRETENRIRHTHENLERLDDLREELGKRLQHLKRQATMAEKYKVFKQEERTVRSEMLALRWRGLDTELEQGTQAVAAQENALEAARSDQRRVEAEAERGRAEHTTASDGYNEVYRSVLDAGAEVARAEESIQRLRDQREQLRDTLDSERRALGDARQHVEREDATLRDLASLLESEEPRLGLLEQGCESAREALSASEDAMQAWQLEGEELGRRADEPARAAEAERSRIAHLEQTLLERSQRSERLRSERERIDTERLEQEIGGLEQRMAAQETAQATAEQSLAQNHAARRDLRERVGELSGALDAARKRQQENSGRLASLQALQQDALGKGRDAVVQWLDARRAGDSPRLAESVQVEPGWDLALETVLGFHLESVCVDGLEGLAAELGSFEEGALSLFETAGGSPAAAQAIGSGPTPLSSRVLAPAGLQGLVEGVYTCETLSDALAARRSLGPGESVVTPAGDWVGPNWLRVSRGDDESGGVLAREREIQALEDVARNLTGEIERWQSELEQARGELNGLEDRQSVLQEEVSRGHREHAALKSQLGGAQVRLEQQRRRARELDTEVRELRDAGEGEERQIAESRGRLQALTEDMQRFASEREAWSARREPLRESLAADRHRWQQSREELHQLALSVQSARSQAEALTRGRDRNREHAERLEARCAGLVERLEQCGAPLEDAQSALQQRLARRQELDESLKAARQRVEACEESLRRLEQQRQSVEGKVQGERERLEGLRMTSQEVRVRRDTVEEQIGSAGGELAALLEALDSEATEQAWAEKLEGLERRIARLGPINLAAIDEYDQQSERKEYLDAQHADLTEALETLQEAIAKIDRETRARFKDTYEKVNAGLGEIFPRLFGGGHAYLEMTGTDLLDTGIAVMARPPGKRNSTIHLLSGGEKALTAVSLVFAIFELNPAPFCLLDEVDAPLDDANVGRFCELMKHMSERVQLVVVTHNKATMEITEQLIGVTMNEPGVSRLVAVDVEEAAELAAV